MVCDLAAFSGVSTLDQLTLDELFALYTGRASYIGIKPSGAAAAAPYSRADFLEKLFDFANFKFLGDSLDVTFKKRITLIFGANSSGKSSLCESLKVLATSEQPSRPLENVRAAGVPSLPSSSNLIAMLPRRHGRPAGYGPRRTTVKYFDTAIAVQNSENPVEPGPCHRSCPLQATRLRVGEGADNEISRGASTAHRDNSQNLTQALQAIRSDFQSSRLIRWQ